ncbi:MAG TPA: hypothetical protein VFV07_06975, partial [Rhizomicrobium sp.]|nr:hypothetical protein [Rhizomicrobium sp.]
MADIGAPEIFDAGRLAPMPRHRFLIGAEIGIVRRHVADAAEPDARDAADVGARGDVEQRAVDAIDVLRHVFEHQHMAGEIGLERRAQKMAEHGDVEGGSRCRGRDVRLQRVRRALDQPAQAPRDRRLAARAPEVRRHRSVRDGKPLRVERGEHESQIAVAEIGLRARGGREPCHGPLGDAPRAIAAAREPHRVEIGIVGRVQERSCALGIGAREMSARQEALRMEMEIDVRVQVPGQRRHLAREFRRQARGRSHDGDARSTSG